MGHCLRLKKISLNSNEQHRIGQHSTAQDRAAQNRTAQDRTGQHRYENAGHVRTEQKRRRQEGAGDDRSRKKTAHSFSKLNSSEEYTVKEQRERERERKRKR
jgi:hypothetical protein